MGASAPCHRGAHRATVRLATTTQRSVVEARRSFGGSGARRPQRTTRGRSGRSASGQSVSTEPLTA